MLAERPAHRSDASPQNDRLQPRQLCQTKPTGFETKLRIRTGNEDCWARVDCIVLGDFTYVSTSPISTLLFISEEGRPGAKVSFAGAGKSQEEVLEF